MMQKLNYQMKHAVNNFFISAAYIPGKHNIEADKFSRKINNKPINLNLTYLLKLLINLATRKLIFLLPK